MEPLDKSIARKIIEFVGNSGQPPPYGYQFFNAGPDSYLRIIEQEYLADFIKEGGSIFKVVLGVFGGGKTHFLYTIRDLGWKHKYVVSYVRLSPKENPFHRLDAVYRAIIEGLIPPATPEELLSGHEQGIASFIKSWYSTTEKDFSAKGLTGASLQTELDSMVDTIGDLASISFGNAVKAAFKALAKGDLGEFDKICQWLKMEGMDRPFHRKFGITQKIDPSTAFQMIRSTGQWIRQIGFSGLIILLDEGERQASLSSDQREQHLTNMRELVDECTNPAFQGMMIFYAVPDENFLNGKTAVYEALRSRLETVFDQLNPTGVKISLEHIVKEPIPFLNEVGGKLSEIYQIAYDYKFETASLEESIRATSIAAYDRRFGDIGYKRYFVQEMIKEFHRLRLSKA